MGVPNVNEGAARSRRLTFGTVWVRNVNGAVARTSLLTFGTATSPTQRS
jgi:hypothetical protein